MPGVDPTVFDDVALYQRSVNLTRRLINRRTWASERPNAEDMVHSVQADLMSGRLSWDPTKVDLMLMMFMTIMARTYREWRRQQREPTYGDSPPEDVADEANSVEIFDRRIDAERALSNLYALLRRDRPRLFRFVLVLQELDHESPIPHKAIARILDIPIEESYRRARELKRYAKANLIRGALDGPPIDAEQKFTSSEDVAQTTGGSRSKGDGNG